MNMTKKAAEAYACVEYRIMEYERNGVSEEYMSLVINMFFDFFYEHEVIKIYQQYIYILILSRF